MQNVDFLVADAKNVEPIQQDSLEKLKLLVEEFDAAKDDVERLEEQLALAKSRFNQISGVDIPQTLLSAGLSELRLADGRKVVVKEDLNVTIKDINSFADFVASRNDDAILKTQIFLPKLPAETIEKIKRIIAKEAAVYPEVKQSVHAQTLKKYVKEITGMSKSVEILGDRYIPKENLPDCLSVFTYYKTKI